MPLLYYWRRENYRRDLDYGAGFHLNQKNAALHRVDIGDSLWAFTRAKNGRYVLAAELVVRAKTQNPQDFRYGRYRVWGDLFKSRYFEVEAQESMEPLLRELSVRINSPALGMSFQGSSAVRQMTLQDHFALSAAAKDLPLETRARILPEERLEAALLLGGEAAIQSLVRDETPGISQPRRDYLFTQAPTRNKQFVKELQQLYEGRCQICAWNPRDIYGKNLCEGHHLQWLSRGGEDALENMALICPNHHTAIHGCDAPFDYADFAFDFGDLRETLQTNLHLPS